MSIDVSKVVEPMQLPSDQDSSGREMGSEEMQNLAAAIESGTLTSTKGRFVKELEARFASYMGSEFSYACNSGTGALHTALSAIDFEPGDEVVTTSVTDMGALTPILYQAAVPVFADIDPHTYNVTAKSIEAVLSDRTKAIMVTHLFGNPARMDEIMELAKSRNIVVIEDCAQAFGATYNGQLVGTFGDIGCFSLQQGKHITTGEGGLVVTNNADLARHMYLFINKAWGYGDAKPDHYFLALNYRMNELSGAVALAQMDKLADFVERRKRIAAAFDEGLSGIPGIETPHVDSEAVHTYWKYSLRIDSDAFEGGLDALAQTLKSKNVFCAPRYIQKPAFKCQVIRDQRTFGNSNFPFNHARPEAVDYSDDKFAGTYDALASVLVLPLNEKYEDKHVNYVVDSIRNAAASLKKG